ncbi:MAG: ketoacyl-ACP synthase III [Ignavibacteriales bacterium]|nr:ketoacyl-ACP synthase III [Ignavibacteriales bacterium]
MAEIKGISYYLPNEVVTNEKLSELFPEWSVQKIAEKVGIKKRYIVDDDQCASDLAVEAANKLFIDLNISPESIDFILLCTQSPDYFLPTTACLLQHRLGLPTTAGALDFNLGCSGFIYGLSLANSLIKTGEAKNVLLITAETYSKFIDDRDKGNRTIFGDAAAACLIVDSEEDKLSAFVYGTDGSGGQNLIVKYGGMRNRNAAEAEEDCLDEESGLLHRKGTLEMKGAEIFNFPIRVVPSTAHAVLDKAGLAIDDISLFVFHQANKYILEHIRKKMGIPEDKFYYFMENCGNTVSSTIPIALHHAMKEKNLKDGDKIMLLGFGVGYSWGGCLLTV